MEPALDSLDPVQPYQPGSWGPSEADRLIIDHDGWLPCTEPAPSSATS